MKQKHDIICGTFITAEINIYRSVEPDGKRIGVIDPYSFVFSFKDNTPMKYDVRDDKKNESTFLLYREDDIRLFVVGECDIWIGKKGMKSYSKQDEESCYDYQGNEKALTGIIGNVDKDMFDIKRIVVFQFKLKEE